LHLTLPKIGRELPLRNVIAGGLQKKFNGAKKPQQRPPTQKKSIS